MIMTRTCQDNARIEDVLLLHQDSITFSAERGSSDMRQYSIFASFQLACLS